MASRSDSPASLDQDRPVIEPSKLGQFIALNGCPQFFKYEFDDELANQRRRDKPWKEAFKPLSFLLAEDGHEFEAHIIDTLEPIAHKLVDHGHIDDWETSQSAIVSEVKAAQDLPAGADPIIITQPRLGLEIDAWPVAGDADLMILWPTPNDGVRIRIMEIKASPEEKTYHQIQTATYTLLCRQFLNHIDLGFDWRLEAGVIHRGTTIDGPNPGDFPGFPLETRELDVKRLLQPGGRFDQLWNRDPDHIRYQLAPKCYNCAYKESCFTDAIEHAKPALLGLTQGEQDTLESYGINTLHDLAELAYPPSDPRPFDYESLTPVDRTVYAQLLNEPGIGERLDRYIQRAQAVLGELDAESMFTPNTQTPAPFIIGSGNGNLPDDDPPFDVDLPFDRGTLFRCYLHVEVDHRRNRILMLSGYLTATATDQERTVSVMASEPPATDGSNDHIEEAVLQEFFTEFLDNLRSLATDIGVETDAPVHFYFYTHTEYDALIDAISRHTSVPILTAVRDVFGLRGALDQQMVSVVRDDIDDRFALPINNRGLLPVMEYVQPNADGFFPKTQWRYTRRDGTEIDLRSAFKRKLFDYTAPYADTTSGIALYPEGPPDGYYPSRARQGSHIPIEYVWAVLGGLPDAAETSRLAGPSRTAPYKWVDPDTQSTRITAEDLKALGERFARCLAHVERGIEYKNPNIPKAPLDLTTLHDFSLGSSSLERACMEYLHLEYSAQRNDLLRHYSLPVRQRIRRGDSIPFVVTETTVTPRGDLDIEGRLLYDQMFDDGDRVASSCRQKGARGATGGSWMVATELTRQGEPMRHHRPHDVERGVGVAIEDLDIQDRRIHLRAIRAGQRQDREFTRRHRDWTTSADDADQYTVCFEPNRVFVLDPRSDDLTGQRALDILRASENNFISNALTSLANGDSTAPETTAFPPEPISDFVKWLQSDASNPRNEQQLAFVEDTTAQFALLQGPPGTGKTSGALAPAILARIISFAGDHRRLAGIVTGESNKAVDEILAGVAGLYTEYQASPTPDSRHLDNVRLVRLTSTKPSNPVDGVEYIDYHTDRAAVRSIVSELLDDTPGDQARLTGPIESEPALPHILLFGTPARIYGFMNQLDIHADDQLTPSDLLRRNQAYFDLLAVDEASMVRLPSLTLAGAFLFDHAQVLIAGDHRQLPPVQHHDWAAETRRTVNAYAPYLPTLDYFRLLNGHSHHAVDSDTTLVRGSGDCPFYQLERTYRCHRSVTQLLRRNVYSEDQIPFRSTETGTITPPTPRREPIRTILDPARPLVLVVHQEQSSRQSNHTEAAFCEAVVSAINDADTTGIVTPHNAQRGLLAATLDDSIEVDTVERYQGGQRDCILVSATASDPDFLAAEQDFILNPNRLNVAMSRMKHKLIVVASETVFDLVPPDVADYNRAKLWKGLYREMDVINRSPDWDGTLAALADSPSPPDQAEDVPVRVYAPRFTNS